MKINGKPLTLAEKEANEKKPFPSNETLNKPLVDPANLVEVPQQPHHETP